MKSILLLLILASTGTGAQNIGIGTSTPTKGKLEIFGANSGGTVAAFGTDGTGISIQRNWPTIGFNQYRDNANIARYMGDGKVSWLYYEPTGGNFGWDVYNVAGTAGQAISATPSRALTILSNGNVGIRSAGSPDASLVVERQGNSSGTALIGGTTHHSYFAWNTQEDTYIRGGKNGSKVIINDVLNGSILNYGKTAFGLYPDNNYVPVIACEMWGAMALTRSYTINVQQSQWISDPSASSYVKVQNTSTNNAIELDIANGNIDGQILIIEGNINPFTIRRGGFHNVYGTSDLVVGGGDVLTLIWNASRVKWMTLAYQNN